jgi:hypothetical protein
MIGVPDVDPKLVGVTDIAIAHGRNAVKRECHIPRIP